MVNSLENPATLGGSAWQDPTTHMIRNFFGLFTNTLTVPHNVWTPMPINFTETSFVGNPDVYGIHPAILATTVVTAGSNGTVLPQGTIHVGSTAAMVAQGLVPGMFITISGPNGAGANTVVQIGGITSTSFTGCTLGVGTLATNQVVSAANEFFVTVDNLQMILGACMTFPAIGNSVGVLGVRIVGVTNNVSNVGFPVGSQMCGNPNAQITLSITPPPFPPGYFASAFNGSSQPATIGWSRAEVFQSSGAAVNCPNDLIQAPSFAVGYV